MSAAEMAPPKSADKFAVKDSKSRAQDSSSTTTTTSSTTASPSVVSDRNTKKPTKAAEAVDAHNGNGSVAEESRRTRSKSEPRGRRTLTCKTCRFTCSNTQEFTHHQNTAHTADVDNEDRSQSTPTRRSSARHKRIASTSDCDTKSSSKLTAKKGEVSAAQKSRVPSVKADSLAPRKSGSAVADCSEEEPIAKRNATDAAASVEDNSASDIIEDSDPQLAPDVPEEKSESGTAPEATDGEKEDDPSTDAPAQTGAATMISTNGPTTQDLSMSGASEDEHDLGEEGGRLIIDDSVSGSNGSVVVPTRCGNIQNRTYMCDDCDFSTTSAQLSLRHKKEKHGYDFNIYECDLCDYATKYKQKLPRHYKLHFSGADVPFDASQGAENAVSPSQPNTVLPVAASTPTPSTSALAPIPAASPTPLTPIGSKRSASEVGLGPTPSVLPLEVICDDGDDEECDDDETIDSDTPPPEAAEGEDQSVAAAVVPPIKKKRKDVSPDKYFEVAEEVASTKYGCAKCGNVYKWKKSLNKHWKEKHGTDPGDNQYTPPGMMILLQQNNHIQTEHRRCCHKTLLERITVKQSDTASRSSSRAHTPQNFLNGHYTGSHLQRNQEDDVDGEEPMSYLPSSIPVGPFVLGTSSQPVFPTSGQRQSLINSLNAPIPSASILDLSGHSVDEPDSVDEASKPVDFSLKKPNQHPTSSNPNPTPLFNNQGMSTEEDDEVSALNQLVASNENLGDKTILKCPKCGEVLKTQTAYSHHMSMHLQSANKRVVRCGVCQTHFPNNDALNVHFMDNHLDVIASHKEAIQKIPHGLQQTYHLLKMPLHSIPKLTSQETEDPLKCNMCDFTAKWPAELQKHAVSHSDERPFICMVCGSTYKWKWDLVKHFEKAHSTLPNPYKRRDPGAASTPQSGNSELHQSASTSQDGYEMEEGEIAASNSKGKIHGANDSVDPSNSFLFDQTSSQDEISVENILRTSQEASLMMSRQPNFLDSPENPQPSSASTSPRPESQGDKTQALETAVLQGLPLAARDSIMSASSEALREEDGNGTRPIRAALTKSIRGRQKEMDIPYTSLISRTKAGGKSTKGPYRGYRTVEGSESSDLKYQCLLCEYKARWPSEIMQHMKNHSSEKPYGCPNCTYKSKWKWDVVKHLKRCGGGGTIKDVLDFTQKNNARDAPPNVMVTPEGSVVQSQQTISPNPGANGEESAATMPKSGVSAENQSSLMQAPYVGAVPPPFTNQAYLNLVLQRFKPAPDSGSSSSAPSLPSVSAAAASSSSSSPSQPDQASGQQAVTYKSVINDGNYHCLSCTFSASSVAELRRHQVVHSEEKPFTCDECSYSTRWKCDMKKHKEKYSHGSPIKAIRPIGDNKTADKKDDKNNLKKCPHCAFETYSIERLQSHINAEHPPSSAKKSSSGHAKFKCKRCPYTTNELVDWINHRHLHPAQKDNDESRQSPSFNGAKEHDEARLRHPRKAVRNYACSKCSFTCLKSTELLEHQTQAHGSHICPFCSQKCDTKDSFLDHLTTHSEFQAKEWEHYFMDVSDNEEDVNNNTDTPSAGGQRGKSAVSVMDTGSSANTIDLTSHSSSPPQFTPATAIPITGQSLPCQWCRARFANIVRLYRHVSTVHPNQKREQEIAEGINVSPASDAAKIPFAAIARKHQMSAVFPAKGENKLAPQLSAGKRTPTPPKPSSKMSGITSSMAASMGLHMLNAPTLVAQLGQIQGAVSALSMAAAPTSSSEMGLNLTVKKKDTTQQYQMFQCKNCTYKTTNLGDYQTHIASHESPAQKSNMVSSVEATKLSEANTNEFRCRYCDEKHNSLMDMYQHMYLHHTNELVNAGEHRELLRKVYDLMEMDARRMPRPDQGKIRTSSTGLLTPKSANSREQQQQQQQGIAGTDPEWLHHKKVLSYKGVPVQAVKMSGTKEVMWYYKCILCNYMNQNPASTTKHTTRAHHSLLEKYMCGYCSFSDKTLQDVLRHQQKNHPTEIPDITVLHYEEITLPVSQPGTDNAGTLSSKNVFASDLKAKSLMPAVQPRSIKQEPVSLSPPPASSACLDLTTDSGNNLYTKDVAAAVATASATDKTMDEAINCSQKHVQMISQSSKGKAEAHEIMEAETAYSSSRIQGVEPANEHLPLFECKHCPYTTRSNYEFRTHCSCHGRKGRYQCDYCTFSHQQLTELAQHRPLHSDQPGYTTAYIQKLEQQEESDEAASVSARPESASTGCELLQCPHCPYRTSVCQSFQIHADMHGQRLQYVCDFCDWSSDRLVILLQHRNVHSSDPDFDASPDDSVFGNPEYAKGQSGEFESKLLDAKIREEVPQSTSTESQSFKLSLTKKLYSCEECPYVTGNRTAYDYHQSLHGSSGCYACEQCSYRTQRWSLLCQHSRVHDEYKKAQAARSNKEDTSPQAAKEASSQGSAEDSSTPASKEDSVPVPQKAEQADSGSQHVSEQEKTAESVQPVPQGGNAEVAEVPNRETAENSSPASDYGSLNNEDGKSEAAADSDLSCQRCPFTTSSRQLLTQHVQQHSAAGEFACPSCDLTCPTKENLLVHVQLHYDHVITMDALQHMLDNQRKGDDRAVAEECNPSNTSPPTAAKTSEEAEDAKDAKSSGDGREEKAESHKVSTRVYACRFCDEEFEDKSIMLQHEQQPHPDKA